MRPLYFRKRDKDYKKSLKKSLDNYWNKKIFKALTVSVRKTS